MADVYAGLSEYGDHVWSLPLAFGIKLFQKAQEKELERRVWMLYCCITPHQDPKKRISFDEMMKAVKKPKATKKSRVSQEDINHFLDVADIKGVKIK